MPTIKSIKCRSVLNSHVKFTNEFIVEFLDGAVGIGASPQGETISIYEDRKVAINPRIILQGIKADGYIGVSLEQRDFDEYLQQHFTDFGRNNTFGLSLAFFNATKKSHSPFDLFGKPVTQPQPPCICLNILNGGWHAYTNPVLSDFSEYILVSKSNNLVDVIECHNEIQRVVKEKLARQAKTVVSGNPVNCFAAADNRECIEFLLKICENLGISNQFDLMIDASAGDLKVDEGYRLAITDNLTRTGEEFYAYWMDLIRQYPLVFLEDPFHEEDFLNWQCLTTTQQTCKVIGDNLYSSDSGRIEEGARMNYAHGAVIKPNQAGTVTGVCEAIETSKNNSQIAITSHRSISTESIFLSLLTCIFDVNFIKIGPLTTDYSSVIRFNEIIRLTGAPICQ